MLRGSGWFEIMPLIYSIEQVFPQILEAEVFVCSIKAYIHWSIHWTKALAIKPVNMPCKSHDHTKLQEYFLPPHFPSPPPMTTLYYDHNLSPTAKLTKHCTHLISPIIM